MLSSASFLALFAVAAAAPLEPTSTAGLSLAGRDTLSDNKEAFCEGHFPSIDDAKLHWDESEAGIMLDDWIRFYNHPDAIQEPSGWLRTLWNEHWPNGGADVVGDCANLKYDCEINVACATFWENHSGPQSWKVRPRYWIFEAANKMHAKFDDMKKTIEAETLFTGLSVDAMIEAFGVGEDTATEDLFTHLAAAFGMAGGLAGSLPGAGPAVAGAAAVIGSAFSIAAVDAAHDGVDAGTISDGLSIMSKNAVGTLQRLLRAAMGQAEDMSDYAKLPSLSADKIYHTYVAKFFNHGYWLTNADADEVFATADSITNSVKAVVASMILKSAGYSLVADVQYKSVEACGSDTGRQWMDYDGAGYCFHLARTHGPSGEIEPTTDVGIYDTMADYALGDRISFYQAILDCAASGKEEKRPNVDDLATFGEIPVCTFNLGAYWMEEKQSNDCTGGPGPVFDPIGRCVKWQVDPIE